MLVLDRELGGIFSKWFDYFRCLKYDHDMSSSNESPSRATQQIADDIETIACENAKAPLFICALLIDTHTPFNDGKRRYRLDRKSPELNFSRQVAAVEYIDSLFPQLLEPMLREDTLVVITSDHGECMGPSSFGHDPRHGNYEFDPEQFEIPFIRGVVKCRT